MQEQKGMGSMLIQRFAILKAYAQRSLLYYQLLNSLLILLLFLREYELDVIVIVLIIIMAILFILLIGMLDRKLKILEREQSYYNKENKEIQEILSLLKEINKK